MNKIRKEIGISTIQYDENGEVKTASFHPHSTFNDMSQFKDQLLEIEGGESQERIITSAERVMASWMNQVNEIELADRDHYKISSSVHNCLKYDSGKVKEISIQFYLESL